MMRGGQGDKETRGQGGQGDKGTRGKGIKSFFHYLLPITYYRLPITHYLLPKKEI
ncbi:hypothetical protein [Tolypothrix sp. VBCCA 56010]|uniref:hypothetical protein n=1 Tax=Tolypothrix sp. VBCCA 56010 TaxID=3137731 RepID=UPI003D7E4D85